MPPTRNTFYQYLGLHSLLIGIFPFYIPVYLWKQQFGIGDISLFIALAGIGFCIALWVWDRLRFMVNLTVMIGISLLLEILLLYNVHVLEMSRPILLALGITYGVYNCFYWTTQRASERVAELGALGSDSMIPPEPSLLERMFSPDSMVSSSELILLHECLLYKWVPV